MRNASFGRVVWLFTRVVWLFTFRTTMAHLHASFFFFTSHDLVRMFRALNSFHKYDPYGYIVVTTNFALSHSPLFQLL